jgi:signal transduction histidine kinase/ActR/RegA family two-component response regulator
MSITRRILIAVILITIIPLLAVFYVFKNSSVFIFSARNLVIFISIFISLLGMTVFSNLIYTMAKLCNSLKIIAKGDINHRVEFEPSNNIDGLATSINQVSQKLRESADDLEKRTILIERFNQEIKKINELKSIYPDVIHELRAPLINIDKIANLLLEKKSAAIGHEEKTFLEAITANARRLSRLVNNLLDVYKIEAGGLTLKHEQFSVKDVIAEAVNSVDSWGKSKNLGLVTRISDDIFNVYADRDRIIQVIVNLLSNAIKFTPAKGKIQVEARVYPASLDKELSQGSETYIEISVQDNGAGILESEKKVIFERYKTASNAQSNVLPSTGLGLPIAKQIVEMHGGKIWAESQAGKGSRFAFVIPQGLSAKSRGDKVLAKGQSKKVLIIDDEEGLRKFLSRTLSRKGYFVTVAQDGLEGLERALELYYDLVITDVRMPNIDGINCIRIIKKISPAAVFIVITAFPVDGGLEEILKKDAYPCIRKPFDLGELLKTVENSFPASVQN